MHCLVDTLARIAVGEPNRSSARAIAIAETQVLELERDGRGAVADGEIIAILDISAVGGQLAVANIDRRVFEEPKIDSTQSGIACRDAQSGRCIDRLHNQRHDVALGRGRSEANGPATRYGRSTEIAIEFESRSDRTTSDCERGVVLQIGSTARWNQQLESAEDLEGSIPLDTRLTENANRRSIRYRDGVFRRSTDDHISVADMGRSQSQTCVLDCSSEGVTDLRLSAGECERDRDVAGCHGCIRGELEGLRDDRRADSSGDGNRLAIEDRSGDTDNIEFRANDIDSARFRQPEVNDVVIDDQRIEGQ